MVTIAIEGIDGAGKTTISRLLESRMGECSASVLRYSHHEVSHPDSEVEDRLRRLRELIWGVAKSNHEDIHSYHRFLVIAAWYHLVDRCLLHWAVQRSASVLILDGWWYRHVAKTALRTGMSPEELSRSFDTLSVKPQRRFLLAVPPDVAWLRKGYSDHEIGYWDGLEKLDPAEAFRRYQRSVHESLVAVEDSALWTVVPVSASDGEDEVVERILDLVRQDLAGGGTPRCGCS